VARGGVTPADEILASQLASCLLHHSWAAPYRVLKLRNDFFPRSVLADLIWIAPLGRTTDIDRSLYELPHLTSVQHSWQDLPSFVNLHLHL